MYTFILRLAIRMYTIELGKTSKTEIFFYLFLYIRALGGLVAQGIGGFYRSCFGTQNRNGNRNDNRNSAGSRGVYCSCLGTRNRNGVRSCCTCLGTRNRNGVRATVPVWAHETGTVLRVEYGGRLSKMAGYRKNMSNVAKVKFLFASNIWEQLIFIPFWHIIDLELSTIIANSIFVFFM